MRRSSLPAILVLVLALTSSALAKRRERKHQQPDRALVNQLPAPLWTNGLSATWEKVGNPISTEGASTFLFDHAQPKHGGEAAVQKQTHAAAADKQTVTISSDVAEPARVNPLLDDKSFFPRYDAIKAEHVVPGMRAVLGQLNKGMDELEASIKPTWEGVLEPLEHMTDTMDRTWGVVSHLSSVRQSPALRQAISEVQPEVVAFQLRLGQSLPVYNALKAIKEGGEWAKLNPTQKRVVELQIRDLELGGVALTGQSKERFNEIQQEVARLVNVFGNNILDSSSNFTKLVTTKADVEGIPASTLGLAAAQARYVGNKDATAENGPWLLSLDASSYTAVVTYSKSRHLREEIYRAYNSRASSGKTDNTPIIEQLLALRLESAKLLGFKNFAEFSMATKMATVSTAEKLLEDLRSASIASGVKDHQQLREYARSQGETSELQWWDISYWGEKMRGSQYNLTDEELRPYLSLPNVLDGMFKLAKRLFDIDVVAADGKAPVWHPDVRFFEVRSPTTGKPVAFFYLDPYARPSEKRGGAWMDSVLSRSKLMAPQGEAVRLPVALAICNQMAPSGGAPGLLTFREVQTLFHEFGHTLQHMLTTVDEGLVSGIRGIPWDAVEVASQFMENWAYDRPTLMSFAKHHKTGELLPDALYERLDAAKTFRAGTGMLRQVNLATKDIELYSHYVPGKGETIYDVDQRVARRTLVMPPMPEDRSLCSFGHIFGGGYSAGYYSYKWSEVLSADCFAAFEEAGLDNEEAVKATGRRYTDTILALGGSVEPTKVFEMFRGHEPSTKAILRHYGLLM